MDMVVTDLDIIVPSFRLDMPVLEKIINLERPPGLRAHLYIIADNPQLAVPEALKAAARQERIRLHVNQCRQGPSVSRNEGIRMSRSPWILLLDDDIDPVPDLLYTYAAAINEFPDALGFAGSTRFPEPVNSVTRAFQILGVPDSYAAAEKKETLVWASASNVLLNRAKMDISLFDGKLQAAEDIDFLTRNSLQYHETYRSLPAALVHHPWWNNGRQQTARFFGWGAGAAQLARKKPASYYIYYDLTNPLETLLLLALLSPLAWYFNWLPLVYTLSVAVLLAEFLICWGKTIQTGKSFSPLVALNLMWTKNVFEAGRLRSHIRERYWQGFAQRVDLAFDKTFPPDFRLDHWRWLKMALVMGSGVWWFFTT